MPLFAFSGNDDLSKQEALDKALLQWLNAAGFAAQSDQDGSLHKEFFFGDDFPVERFMESYQTVSLFVEKKALILKNVDKVPAASLKRLETLFKTDNPDRAVFATLDKWGTGSTLKKIFTQHGEISEFKLPYANQIPAWLNQRAKQKYQRHLGLSEAQFLQDMVGADMAELDRELEKLDTFLPKKQAISHADIEELIAPTRAIDIFEFQKNMGLRQKTLQLQALRSMLDNGDPAFQIALLLFRHFLVLLKIRDRLDQGQNPKDIADALKLNYFFHFQRLNFVDQARSRSVTLWKKCLIRLSQMELEFKQGKMTQRFEIEMAFATLV